MPIKPVKKITAWSKSRFDVYEKCPALAKYKFLDKLKEPGSPAMDRGLEIHKKAEDYLNGKLLKLPEELELFPEEFEMLLKNNAQAEVSWAFRNDWTPTGWFAKDAWCRVKLDAFFKKDSVLHLIDFKTGKKRDGYDLQLELYAIAGMLMDEGVSTVEAELWFLDEGEIVSKQYERNQLGSLKEKWTSAVRPMLNDDMFSPRPGYYCKWCHFRSSNEGPCKFA